MGVQITLHDLPPIEVTLFETDYGSHITYEGSGEITPEERVIIQIRDGLVRGTPGDAHVDLKRRDLFVTGHGPVLGGLDGWSDIEFIISLPMAQFSFEPPIKRPPIQAKLHRVRGPYTE
ncbi:MAG: hypothetical protein A2Y57_02315 [Candidatus Woykebacteria bacterium RBG_13_40_7b]|uniref:Uncharacterized protein n=1 Tax=Candidatus Woykebacteria bacterium RBG_13_40_7b TaxID=1802594 RepID=A0A1G1WBD6_9BACT|nr:MAG: hypothetical protein A2Y57_02315 [Candidatus Woykebacteria bacterium RBG_13_40_7b]